MCCLIHRVTLHDCVEWLQEMEGRLHSIWRKWHGMVYMVYQKRVRTDWSVRHQVTHRSSNEHPNRLAAPLRCTPGVTKSEGTVQSMSKGTTFGPVGLCGSKGSSAEPGVVWLCQETSDLLYIDHPLTYAYLWFVPFVVNNRCTNTGL